MRGSARAALAVALGCSLAAATPSRSEEPAPEDPPLCREALAAHPDESALAALGKAEQELATRARQARTEAQRILHKHLGDGEQGGLAATDAAEPLLRKEAELGRAGKVICHCRQRRGDPDRESCEFLYPERLP